MNFRLIAGRNSLFLLYASLSTPCVSFGQSTWDGSDDRHWSTPGNWQANVVPPNGGAIKIADSTGNNLNLEASHSIGLLTFGTSGTRTSAFVIQTGKNRVLTYNGGLTASGSFTTGVPLPFRIQGNHVIGGVDQIWNIGGSAGTVLNDSGVGFLPINDQLDQGSVVLEKDILKQGSGQLSFIGVAVSGIGDIVGTTGSIKFNAGSSLPLDVGGPGTIEMQGSSKLFTVVNSGVMGNFNRPIVMRDSSSWTHDSGDARATVIASNIAWLDNSHLLTVDSNLELSGTWSGTETVSISGDHPLTLTGANGGFTGSIANTNVTAVRLDGAFGGSLSTNNGILIANGLVSGDATLTGGTLALRSTLTGTLFANPGTKLMGEPTVGGDIDLAGVTIWADPSTPAALGNGVGDQLILSNDNEIVLATVPTGLTTFPVLKYASLTGGAGDIDLAEGAANYRGASLSFATPGEIRVTVAPGAVSWNTTSSGTWNANSSANWTGSSTKFFHLDAVTFPNKGDLTITLSGRLMPGVITFSNTSTDDYTLSGSGTISGGASIDKTGNGKVTLGGGSAQDYTGSIRVRNGLLVMGSDGAFGHSSGITVEDGAQVNINGKKPGDNAARGYTYTISGTGSDADSAGAIVNSVNADSNGEGLIGSAGIKSLILAGDATISSKGRYDIGFVHLAGHGTIQGNHHTLTVKTDVVSEGEGFDGMAFRAPASDIDIVVLSPGVIWAEDFDDAFGGDSGTLRIKSGAKAGTYGYRTIATPVFLEGGGTLHNQGAATGTWTGGITLEGNATIRAQTRRIVIASNIVETGGPRNLSKTGDSVLSLNGNGSYTGTTAVSGGTFLVNGSLGTGGTITVSGSATIGGSGSIARAVIVNGTLSPGQSVGALQTAGVTMAAGSKISFEIDRWTGTTPGVDWDLLNATSITLNQTTSSPVEITIPSLPADFNGTAKTLTIAVSTATISNFDANEFDIFTPNGPANWAVKLAADNRMIQLTYLGGGAASPFETWATTTHGLSGTNALPAGNPDGDGFTNYEEFLFGGSPNAPTPSLSQLTRAGSVLTLRWFERSGCTYVLQESSTLEDPWPTSAAVPTTDSDQSGALSGYVRKKATLTITGGRKFLRIQGTE
ncbi:hypothetical protein OKA05_01210 [Luteolibacter arcticus]|uniref:Autotransporter-associated beta strand repeat-containing protein n=1 Tax=Luteolibacter arcticus TaxID=1581411 RepID=A0ABT3GBZ6_9BACT|nr:hypothetical protein [Luteolibacter arcticus]MCW1921151.1 hypothetical protein [Luteolibacter arcticus]